jgi:demethylmenaquinone methyltransferase/2-methoxy-6-polyprenyl-1,4-benzoquinol methylase
MSTGVPSTEIHKLFNTIAEKYDITNLVLTCGWSALWYRAFVKAILKSPPPQAMLDLCCGTGAVIQHLVREMKKRNLPVPAIDCVDFSEKMVDQAGHRLHSLHIYPRFITADAASIPLCDSSYDTITIGYGIRNLTEKKKALHEAVRLLKPNGNLFILELTPPRSAFVRLFHTMYMKTAVPFIGRLLTRHSQPYQYLDHSIEHFSLPHLLHTLQEVGFSCQPPISLSCGIATIIQAGKI